MPETAETLYSAAAYITLHGLHTGEQFAAPNGALDICAAAYHGAHGRIPAEFYTDEDAAITLIEASAPAMAAIRAVSDSLETEPCTTEIAPGHEVPDYVEHVSTWAMTPPVGASEPPSFSEVVGRLMRVAHQLTTPTPDRQHRAAA